MEEDWPLEWLRVGAGEEQGLWKLGKGVLYGSEKHSGSPRTFFEFDRGSLICTMYRSPVHVTRCQ